MIGSTRSAFVYFTSLSRWGSSLPGLEPGAMSQAGVALWLLCARRPTFRFFSLFTFTKGVTFLTNDNCIHLKTINYQRMNVHLGPEHVLYAHLYEPSEGAKTKWKPDKPGVVEMYPVLRACTTMPTTTEAEKRGGPRIYQALDLRNSNHIPTSTTETMASTSHS